MECYAAGWSSASFPGSDESGGSPRTSTTTQQPWPASLPSPLSSLPSVGSPGHRSQSAYTASKVGKSDGKQSFAALDRNDAVAPIPDGRRSGVPLGSSTDSGPSRPALPTEPRIRYPRASLRQEPTRPACSFARRMVAVSAPIAPRLCLRERPPAVPRDRARPGRHRRARTGPSPGRTGRSFSRDIR